MEELALAVTHKVIQNRLAVKKMVQLLVMYSL